MGRDRRLSLLSDVLLGSFHGTAPPKGHRSIDGLDQRVFQRKPAPDFVEVLSLCPGESREEEHQRREEEYRRIFVG